MTPDPDFSRAFLRSITSSEMLARLDELKAHQPQVLTLSYMLGQDLFLEWAHTVGVIMDEGLRDLVPPIAPIRLRRITASHSESLFLWTGLVDARNFLGHYHRFAKPEGVVRVLDFGCGGGRMTRFVSQSGDYDVYGSDVNPDHVKWCADNLQGVVTSRNDILPPLRFDAGSMGFVYALSVFSHLPESVHKAWLDEVARVSAPGGIVLLTTHGQHALRIIADSETHQKMFKLKRDDARRILGCLASEPYIHVEYDLATNNLAQAGDGYGNCFISEAYVRRKWPAHGFDLLDYIPGGMRGFQDIVLLRKA